MCAGNLDLQASYDYIGPEAKAFMKEKIKDLDPFSSSRSPVSLYDKSIGRSPFTGMTLDRAKLFTKRNRKNFIRNHPTKEVLDSLDKFRKRDQRNQDDAGEETMSGVTGAYLEFGEREDQLVAEQLLQVEEPGQVQAHLQLGQHAFGEQVMLDESEDRLGGHQQLAGLVEGDQLPGHNLQLVGANDLQPEGAHHYQQLSVRHQIGDQQYLQGHQGGQHDRHLNLEGGRHQ